MGEPPLEDLERVFKALANINRLKLLVQLQSPKGYNDIELPPSRGDSAGSDGRAISRQAVRGHIQELMSLGVVVEAESEGQGSEFIVDHARLFALLEQMRTLATVQPSQEVEGPTMDLEVAVNPPTVEGPHLVLVRGVHEGRAFSLDEEGEEVSWTIGRRSDAEVPLDYDAYVSAQHARVVCREGDYYVMDLPTNKNGTFLNWQRMTSGGIAPLEPGDILGIGRSILVFRE